MKKVYYMYAGIFVACCLAVVIVGNLLSVRGSVNILDREGNVLVSLSAKELEKPEEYLEEPEASYVLYALREAAGAIGSDGAGEDGGIAGLLKYIQKDTLEIYTAYNPAAQSAAAEVCDNTEVLHGVNYAISMTDDVGDLALIYSHDKSGQPAFYESVPTYAASAIKPLSVYAPAIEMGFTNYSKCYLDAPIKDGWPNNTRPYTGDLITAQKALQYSNNAVAVRILMDLGVADSLDFLEESFGFDLSYERNAAEQDGEDAVLSNIALGYLHNGIDEISLLSAYRIFCTGGEYRKATAVIRILSGEKLIYEREGSTKKVISSASAYIMNRLLLTVTQEDGTGAAAGIKDGEIIGKTGTSDGFIDNWFIGEAPSAAMAVWYGTDGGTLVRANSAPALFHDIWVKLGIGGELFPPSPTEVRSAKYCAYTGLLAGKNCRQLRDGYYTRDNMPKKCNQTHQKED